jgi:hypothetical protein
MAKLEKQITLTILMSSGSNVNDDPWSTTQLIQPNWPEASDYPIPQVKPISEEVRLILSKNKEDIGNSKSKTQINNENTALRSFTVLSYRATQCIAQDHKKYIDTQFNKLPGKLSIISNIHDNFLIPWELLQFPHSDSNQLEKKARIEAEQGIYRQERYNESPLPDLIYYANRIAIERQIITGTNVKSDRKLPVPSITDLKILLILCPDLETKAWDLKRKDDFGASIEEDLKRVFGNAGVNVEKNIMVLKYENANTTKIYDTLGMFGIAFDMVYYFGHIKNGGFLLSGSQKPSHMNTLGMQNGEWNPAPLVFINGCSSAAGDAKSDDSMPEHFLKNGTSHFIGTYWDVHPETAHQMGVRFFMHTLIDLDTLPEGLRKARCDVKRWVDRNRKINKSQSAYEQSLPTCPDWGAYTLTGVGSSFKHIVLSPGVHLHYGSPSLHQFYFLESIPGGYTRHLEPHPLASKVDIGIDSTDNIDIRADIISNMTASLSDSEKNIRIIGKAFSVLDGDDGIFVRDESIDPNSKDLNTLSDINNFTGYFKLVSISPNFYLNNYFERLLRNHEIVIDNGNNNGKVIIKYISEIQAFPDMLESGLVDGIWLFGAVFHAAKQRARLEKKMKLLKSSSVVKFYIDQVHQAPIPVVIFAEKKDVDHHPLLMRNFLYRLRESMYQFYIDDSQDVLLANEMGMDKKILPEIRKTQYPTDVYFDSDENLPIAIEDLHLKEYVETDLSPMNPAESIPTDILNKFHDDSLCVCTKHNYSAEDGVEIPRGSFVLDKAKLVSDVSGYFEAIIEQWEKACICLVKINDECSVDTLRLVARRLLELLPASSTVTWTGENISKNNSWMQPRTFVVVIPYIIKPIGERLLDRLKKTLENPPARIHITHCVIDYRNDPGNSIHEAFDQLNRACPPSEGDPNIQDTATLPLGKYRNDYILEVNGLYTGVIKKKVIHLKEIFAKWGEDSFEEAGKYLVTPLKDLTAKKEELKNQISEASSDKFTSREIEKKVRKFENRCIQFEIKYLRPKD